MRSLLFVAALVALSCTDDANTVRTLRSSGFTEIQVGGYDPFGCGKDDNFATKFTAKNAQGSRVSGTVCCGIWKNCTVRF